MQLMVNYFNDPVKPSMWTLFNALAIVAPCSHGSFFSSPDMSQVKLFDLLSFRRLYPRKMFGFCCSKVLNPASSTLIASYARAPVAVIP